MTDERNINYEAAIEINMAEKPIIQVGIISLRLILYTRLPVFDLYQNADIVNISFEMLVVFFLHCYILAKTFQ